MLIHRLANPMLQEHLSLSQPYGHFSHVETLVLKYIIARVGKIIVSFTKIRN